MGGGLYHLSWCLKEYMKRPHTHIHHGYLLFFFFFFSKYIGTYTIYNKGLTYSPQAPLVPVDVHNSQWWWVSECCAVYVTILSHVYDSFLLSVWVDSSPRHLRRCDTCGECTREWNIREVGKKEKKLVKNETLR